MKKFIPIKWDAKIANSGLRVFTTEFHREATEIHRGVLIAFSLRSRGFVTREEYTKSAKTSLFCRLC